MRLEKVHYGRDPNGGEALQLKSAITHKCYLWHHDLK